MFWRTVYYILDWPYYGRKEQAQIDRQKHLKYMACEQIKRSRIELKKVKGLIIVPYWKKDLIEI